MSATKPLRKRVPPSNPPEPSFNRHLIAAVADLTGAAHRANVGHRDYDLYHALVDRTQRKSGVVALSLIDLHRSLARGSDDESICCEQAR